jgi:hypothetical protein
MALMGLEQTLEQHRIEGRGRAAGATRLIGQARGAEGVIPGQELVDGLPADPIAPAELGERAWGVLGIEHETLALVHG